MFEQLVGSHICGAGGSDAAADLAASGARRQLCDRPGPAVFHVAAGGFEAFAGFGECGAGATKAQWAGALFEVGGETDAAGAGVDRGVPEILGGEF